MAVDTRSRRAACIGLAMAPFLVLPNPNGAISPDDREQTAYCYLIPGLPRVVPCADLSSYVCDEPDADWDDQGGTQPPAPPTPEASTFKAQVQIQMCPTWIYGADSDCVFYSSEREIDPADYPGLTGAWFQAVGWGYGPSIQLVDAAGVVYATLTLGDLAYGSDRQRVLFLLNPVKTKYYFKTLGAEDHYFREVTIILDQENAVATRVQIPMLDGDQSTSWGPPVEADFWAFNHSIHSTAYAYGGALGTYRYDFRPFLLNKANWSKVDHWTLEIIGMGSGWYDPTDPWYGLYGEPIVGGVTVALFNRTKNLMVAGTEVNVSSNGAPERAEINFSNDAANFDDGDYFEIRAKTGSVSYDAFSALYSVNLYCKLIELAKCEIHNWVGGPASLWMGDASLKYVHEETKYPAATPWYFEQAGGEWGDGQAYTGLIYCGTTDIDPYGQFCYPTVVSSFSGTWTSTNEIKTYNGADAVAVVGTFSATGGAKIELTGFPFWVAGFTQPIMGVQGHFLAQCAGEELDVAITAGGVTLSERIGNALYGPPPFGGVSVRYVYDYSFERPWAASDFGPGFSVLIEIPPSVSSPTSLAADYFAFSVGSGLPVARLDYSIPADARYSPPDFQRTPAPLSDTGRYVVENRDDISNGTVSYWSSAYLVGLVAATYTPANPGGGGTEEPPPCVEWGDCTEPIGEMVEYAN